MKARILASLSLLGASAACLGVFLDWFTVQRVALEGGVTAGSAAGTDMTIGLVALAAAAAAAIFSILWLARGASQTLAAIVLVLSLVAAGSAGFVWATLDSRYVDYVAQNTSSDLSADEIREVLEPLVAEDQLKPDVESGVILTTAGGLLAALFSFVGALRSRRSARAPDGPGGSEMTVQREAARLESTQGPEAAGSPIGRSEKADVSGASAADDPHPNEGGSDDDEERSLEKGPETSEDEPARRRSELGDTWTG